MTDVAALINRLARTVADFPSPGVQFRDLTPVLADPAGLAVITEALAELADGVDLIAGVDARGFLLGAAVALHRGTGVLAVRKGGKLPPPVHTVHYDLEYGSATLEIPAEESTWPVATFSSSTTCWPPAGRWRPPRNC